MPVGTMNMHEFSRATITPAPVRHEFSGSPRRSVHKRFNHRNCQESPENWKNSISRYLPFIEEAILVIILSFRATIETGSDQALILQHSTSVGVRHVHCPSRINATVLSIVKKNIQVWIDALESFLKKKKQNPIQSTTNGSLTDSTNFRGIPFSCRTFDNLRNHLENLVNVGCELGFLGLSLAMEALRKYLSNSNQFLSRIVDDEGKALCQRIVSEMDELISQQLNEQPATESERCNGKVRELKKCLSEQKGDPCIIFVDRIYIAAFLNKVLQKLLPQLKIQYIAGNKLQIDDLIRLTPRYQVNSTFSVFHFDRFVSFR